jgi:hypothetical protein
MKCFTSVEALLKKASSDYATLKTAYQSSLHEKVIRADLKVEIKNIFENLRSCLDYMAHDIFDAFCAGSKMPDRLYFPIRATANEFSQAINKDYPNLQVSASAVFNVLDSVQPYRDPWLGQFNKLNNQNKHQDLVPQTRTESRRVTVTGPGGGSVSWGPGVKYGSGVSVMGVPIDPRTQMPVPNDTTKTEVVIWVDFRFQDIDQPVLPFVEQSLRNVEKMYRDLLARIP